MKTNTKPNTTLPFELGDERSFGGLTLVPLFPRDEPKLEYVGLDEAVARGLVVKEVDAEAIVGELLVENPLDELVLLYEGEELVGAKQNRIIQELTLVPAHSKARLPVRCVEAGRWALRTPKFQPAPHAAYPSLRKESRMSQQAVWTEVAAKAQRLEAPSPTGAQEAIYVKRRATIDEYAASLPRLHGQSGVLVGIGGKIVFLDYVSRSDVFAGLYAKLLRGYALEALETRVERPIEPVEARKFLADLETASLRLAEGSAASSRTELEGRVGGSTLHAHGELVAVAAFPAA